MLTPRLVMPYDKTVYKLHSMLTSMAKGIVF